jgi:hypothetical protein
MSRSSEVDLLNWIVAIWVNREIFVHQFLDIDQVSLFSFFASSLTHKTIVSLNLDVCHQQLETLRPPTPI